MEEIDVEKFKAQILELYKVFPNGSYAEEILKKVIITEEMLNELVDKGILFREKMGNKNYYTLGANGLSLVSSWKMEDLTNKMWWLSKCVLALTVIGIVLTAIGIILTFAK